MTYYTAGTFCRMDMSRIVDTTYGNRLRARVSGLCWLGDSLLMIRHRSMKKGSFWAPPGGGIDFGESAESALEKEFLEETGLVIKTGRLQFACEFIDRPLHSIELLFETKVIGGELAIGSDPEMAPEDQIIAEVRYMPFQEINSLSPIERHGIFEHFQQPDALKTAYGYFKI